MAPKDDAAASAERALKDRQDAYVQSLRNADNAHAADLAALSYRFGDRDKKATTPDEKLAIAKEYEVEKAAIEKRYADEAKRAKDAAQKDDAEKAKRAAEQVAEFQRKALVDGLIAAGRETDAQRQSIVDRWKRTLDGIADAKVRAEAQKAADAELAAFDKRQQDRADREASKITPGDANAAADAGPTRSAGDVAHASPVTRAVPGESPAARDRRFRANQSAKALAELRTREDRFGLSADEAARRDRLTDLAGVPAFGPSSNHIDASSMPANGPLARRVVERAATPVASKARGGGDGGVSGGQLPPVTVNSPGFDVVKLAAALAHAVTPIIERQVDALGTRMRAQNYAGRVKSGF